MPSPKSDAIRMRHMLDACRKALLFTENKSRSDLDSNEKLALALVRLVEIIGEAASKITPDVQQRFSSIPWREITGTRNRLIHGYDQVNLSFAPLPPSIRAEAAACRTRILPRSDDFERYRFVWIRAFMAVIVKDTDSFQKFQEDSLGGGSETTGQ